MRATSIAASVYHSRPLEVCVWSEVVGSCVLRARACRVHGTSRETAHAHKKQGAFERRDMSRQPAAAAGCSKKKKKKRAG